MKEEKQNRIVTSKYTAYSFIPLNLYMQFTKYNNLFFLVTLILLIIPSISPFTPYTYLIALSIVLGVAMIKDGIEDYNRHQQDNEINEKPVFIIKYDISDEKLKIFQENVEDLKYGDYVVVMENEEIPADIVLLNSLIHSTEQKCKNYCFVQTCNIDGEVNLKKKFSLFEESMKKCTQIIYDSVNFTEREIYPSTCSCMIEMLKKIKSLDINDNRSINSDIGCYIKTETDQIMQSEKNILLRGSKLKNTKQIFGIVISVGNKTQLSKSLHQTNIRISIFEMMVNNKLIYMFLFYFIVLTITSILASLFLKKDNIQYLYLSPNLGEESLKLTGTNYILFSYIIPLSLFVMIEISRIFQALYISNDEKLRFNGINSRCRNSNVIEDIGIVEYVLTDKTGTLTKNEMILRKYQIKDFSDFVERNELVSAWEYAKNKEKSILCKKGSSKITENDLKNNFPLLLIFSILCCNSVERLNEKYEGVSQDEVCILNALEEEKCYITERNENYILLKIGSNTVRCDISMVYPFSSERQRMTVVMTIFKKHFLFIKGSDQMVLQDIQKMKIDKDLQVFYCKVQKIINSNSDLRSLVFAYKEINSKEFVNFKVIYENIGFEDRKQLLDKLFTEMETNLIYIGTTFIEDKLQDNVSQTLSALKMAGIKTWMITGDKRETSISCGINCGILDRNWESTNKSIVEKPRFIINNLKESSSVLDCDSVIIYRATPEMKAEITKLLVKKRKNVLGIGDGNNDVPMLQSSCIGVGIQGKEGTQASLTSDFSIPEFQCLKRLLLVHGRYNFMRFSKLTLNSFFKNFYFILIQFYYNFFNGFSGKPIYNFFFLNYYNVLFTSFVPLSICLFDKDHPEEYLMENPRKYKEPRKYFSNLEIFYNLILSLIKASTVFWLSFGILYINGFESHNGLVCGYTPMNNYFSLIVFTTILVRQIRSISFFVIFSYIGIFLSLFLYFLTIFGIQEIDNEINGSSLNLYGVPLFYLASLCIISLTVFVDYLFDIIYDKYHYEK
ncbi:aminophospholipid translocase [Hamiltosporidium tvaerminnensis]|nr:aminophospholipid translocase [Hamiltosporidium tvaerminnensis]